MKFIFLNMKDTQLTLITAQKTTRMKNDMSNTNLKFLGYSFTTISNKGFAKFMANPENIDKGFIVNIIYEQDMNNKNTIYVEAYIADEDIFIKEYVKIINESLMISDSIAYLIACRASQICTVRNIIGDIKILHKNM